MQLQDMTPYMLNQALLGIRTQLLIPGNPKLHLFQNNIVPSPASLLADFTEATYDGYAAGSMPLSGGPYRRTDNSFAIASTFSFNMTGSTTPNNIYGYYLTDFTNAQLIAAARFANAWPMVDAFSHIAGFVELAVPQNGIVGGSDPTV
jgi:hypothetical protein